MASADDLLWSLFELPAGSSVYKGKNYWTVSVKQPHGYLKVRNRRLADAVVEFVEKLKDGDA